MPSKRRFDLIALCASILWASLLPGPAAANIRYMFTSDRGSFVYDFVSFFEGGSLSAGDLVRYSGDFEDVYFGNSYILLDNAVCRIADDCFDATFGLSGIFQTLVPTTPPTAARKSLSPKSPRANPFQNFPHGPCWRSVSPASPSRGAASE